MQKAAVCQIKGLYFIADVSLFSPVLCAIKDDSEKVPTLLTDYILKGTFTFLLFVHQIVKTIKWTDVTICSTLQSCVLPKAQSGQGALCVAL